MSTVDVFPLALIAVWVLGTLSTIGRVGKPREPLSGGDAVAITIINAALIVGLIMLWPWGGGA
jgi:hypothetical protein